MTAEPCFEVELTINGTRIRKQVAARQHLADFLREELELTGTHLGCEQGACGACTVLLDGAAVRSCLVLAVQAAGRSVETIEGLSERGSLAELQAAFIARNAAQCGYCTAGMLLTAAELLAERKPMSRDEIRAFISGNFCRCTGYQAIVDAIADVLDRQTPDQPALRENLSGASGTHVGRRVPRSELPRLLAGRGRYVGDLRLPRMLHLAFLRSPYAHARIVAIDATAAKSAPGVARIFIGSDLVPICEPLVGVAHHRRGHKSAPQYPMAVERAVWQGQPVAAVVAASRAEAEDAAELIQVQWEELPALLDAESALGAAPIHHELGDNLAFEHRIAVGDLNKAVTEAAVVVEEVFRFERQTGLTLEPRGLVADYDPAADTLTVHHSHQSPFQMQDVFSRHLRIPEHRVRVVAPDIGGGFGLKINVYAEELAVVSIAKMIGQPIKFLADRLESFLADGHVRDHKIRARLAADGDGRITAMEVDDLAAIGAYGMPLRFNIAEGMMAVTFAGAPYAIAHYRGRTRSAYVNKNLIGMYRGVGIPLACVITEVLVDRAAAALGIDPALFRRQNFWPETALPLTTPGGVRLETVSLHKCHDRLLTTMDYDRLRDQQKVLQTQGIYRGIGIANFLEATAYGPPYYGPSEARISVQDGCTLRLEPSGVFRCLTSTTDQGQGTLTGIRQIVADTLGVGLEDVVVAGGDSGASPYGGGAWASRGMAVGGEAALKAARTLKASILALAGAITQARPEQLDIRQGQVVNRVTLAPVISVAEVGKIGYFRQDTLPKDFVVELTASCSHVDNHTPYYMANGAHAAYVEVDIVTGFVRVMAYWAVDDCGRVVNPLLVDEQVRGGVVQGIGAVLYEECSYNETGSVTNASMAEYLAPTAGEMPDIVVEHVETPEPTTALGAKGIGEAGVIGAMGAVWVAVNDALRPLGTSVTHQPFTPERILRSIAMGTQRKS
jgi:carbon-monoxide dehydrogenase large subunit